MNDPSLAMALDGDDCPRCGLAPGRPPGDVCMVCGYAFALHDRDLSSVVRATREARYAGLRWLVGPTLYLASLVVVRSEILDRIGGTEERADDSGRLDAIDTQIQDALHGVGAARFQEAMLLLADVAGLRDSFPGRTS